jgi:hypothetical protein
VTDDPGVMGNLPRSRPGRRSDKRAAEVKPPKRAAAKPRSASKTRSTAKAGSTAKAQPRAAQRAKPKAKPAQAPRAPQRERAPRTSVTDERVEERQGQDPITAALRAGLAVGDAGVKVLAKIVGRLPRP